MSVRQDPRQAVFDDGNGDVGRSQVDADDCAYAGDTVPGRAALQPHSRKGLRKASRKMVSCSKAAQKCWLCQAGVCNGTLIHLCCLRRGDQVTAGQSGGGGGLTRCMRALRVTWNGRYHTSDCLAVCERVHVTTPAMHEMGGASTSFNTCALEIAV